MKDIDRAGKANGIDGPVCIAVFIVDHLQHTSTAKALQCLGTRMFISVLRIVDRKTHDAANLVRERPQVVSRRSDPYGGLWFRHRPPAYSSTAIRPSTDCRTAVAIVRIQRTRQHPLHSGLMQP